MCMCRAFHLKCKATELHSVYLHFSGKRNRRIKLRRLWGSYLRHVPAEKGTIPEQMIR